MNQPAMNAEQRQAIELGIRYTELNAILRKIRFREEHQATPGEIERIRVIKQEIADIKKYGYLPGWERDL